MFSAANENSTFIARIEYFYRWLTKGEIFYTNITDSREIEKKDALANEACKTREIFSFAAPSGGKIYLESIRLSLSRNDFFFFFFSFFTFSTESKS